MLALRPLIRRFDLRPVLSPDVTIDTGRERLSIKAWAPKNKDDTNQKIRWLSVMELITQHMQLTRVIVWAGEGVDAPHFIMEHGAAEDGAKGVGTITLCPRADLMLDRAYQNKYYGGAYDALRNTCADRPSWRHYLPSTRPEAKMLMGQSISYAFDNSSAEEVAFLYSAGARALEWWLATEAGSATEATRNYDQRYREALLDDPDNTVIANLFGGDVIADVLRASSGWFGDD